MPAETIHQKCTSLQERVSAIETLLDGKTFITGAPVQTENGYDLGYVQVTLGEDGKLTTSREQTISINHGITPEFNVTVGPDPENPNNGKIYWLINGEPMRDASGNPVEAPKDGKDAPEPTFHIWDGVLCYTFDQNPDLTDRSKNTWYELQNVIGPQGPVGPQGPSGLSITTDENGKVTITYDHDANPDTPAQTAELPTYSDFMELYNQVQDIQASINGISTLVGLITGGEDGTPQEFITDYRPLVDENGIITGFQFQTVKYVQNAEGSFEVVASGTKTVQGIGELISLEQDPADGKYYWVLPGGTKLPVKGEDGADAAQPQFCIVNGHLWYTLDENPGEVGAAGHKWQDLGSVAALLKEGNTDTNKSLVTITRKTATDGENEVLAFTFGTGEDAVTIEVPTQGAFEELLARVAALETKIETLEKLVEAADNKINSLAGTMRVIHSFEKITDSSGKILKGFRITWKKYEPVTDANGNFKEWKPVIETETEEYRVDDTISLTQDESGNWYWVINSFNSDGNVIESVQIPFETEPQLKVIDGILYVALVNNPGTDYNDPTKWMRVQMPKESTSQQSLISIKEDGNYVIFTFAGNPPTEIKVPSDAAYKDILKAIDTINSNLVNLQKLVDEINARAYVIGTEPYNVDGIEKGQYIKFSDGTKVLIKYGEKGDKGDTGITPKFRINDDGFWMISYDDGKNYNHPLTNQDGDFVRATPKLRIYNGYWQVSYNNNGTDSKWDYLLDEDGNQIPASGADGDTVFAENPISAGEDKDGDSKPDSITITLADGTTYTIPTWDAFVVLKNTVLTLEQNVSTFSTLLEGKKYIKDVQQYTEEADEFGRARTGYKITYVTYTDGTVSADQYMYIYNGSTIGVKQHSDGKYYWTINGGWLFSEGEKVLAEGKEGVDGDTPNFRINPDDGQLEYTFDDPQSQDANWKKLGDVTGNPGSANVTYTEGDDYVTIGLPGGGSVTVPTYAAFTTLKNTVLTLEQNVQNFKALLAGQRFIKDCTRYTDPETNITGWKINIGSYQFDASGNVSIKDVVGDGTEGIDYIILTDGVTPIMTVEKYEDDWYWKVNGKWLLDSNDNKVKATGKDGATPSFRVDESNGDIYVTINGVETKLGNIKGIQGEPGSSDLTKIEEKGDQVIITFGGTTIMVPTWSAFEKLRNDVATLNTNVTSYYNLINGKKYIKSWEQITGGYEVTIVTYNNGQQDEVTYKILNGVDGTSPIVGLRYDEATDSYYWTVTVDDTTTDLEVDGKPVKANGIDGVSIIPTFTVGADGHLYAQFEGEDTIDCGKVIGPQGPQGEQGTPGIPGETGPAGPAGSEIIKNADGTAVIITLADGETKVEVPIWKALSIDIIDSKTIDLSAAFTNIPFTIYGAFETAPFIGVICEGNWRAEVTLDAGISYPTNKVTGKLVVPSANSQNGQALIFVSVNGQTAVKTIRLSSQGSISIHPAYVTDYREKTMDITFSSDLSDDPADYRIEVKNADQNSWIKSGGVQTKAIFDPQITVERNTSSAGRSAELSIIYGNVTVPFTVTQLGVNDLTGAGMRKANCYIVSEPGGYSFSLYKGNSTEYINTATSARIVQTDNVLVKDVELTDDGRVIFVVDGTIPTSANTIIGVYKSDADAPLWSWHIWIRPQLSSFVSVGDLMECNLGASSASAEGLYYQWGRKDPIFRTKFTVAEGPVTDADADPKVFYTGGISDGGWTPSTEGSATLLKSEYDPCPFGYRVPDNAKWANPEGQYFYDTNTNGVQVLGKDYPSGYIDATGKYVITEVKQTGSDFLYNYYQSDTWGGVWSASLDDKDTPYCLWWNFYQTWKEGKRLGTITDEAEGKGPISNEKTHSKGVGLQVRCVKE